LPSSLLDLGGQSTLSNRQVIEHLYELFDRRDFESAVEFTTDDLEMDAYFARLHAEPFHGPGGMLKFMSELFTDFEDFRITRNRYVEVADSVIVFCSSSARGRVSGVPLELESIHVWDLRDGRVARFSAHLETDEMINAITLRYGHTAREQLERELAAS
jgi:ketosteroid isomerase-like protein